MRIEEITEEKKGADIVSKLLYAPIAAFTAATDTIFLALNGVYDFILPQNPVHGRREFHILPRSAETLFGEINYQSTLDSQGGISTNRPLNERVQRVFENLVQHAHRKDFTYDCNVIKANVINAWAMAGGKIAIYEGLIEKLDTTQIEGFEDLTLDDKLAAVLGHELAHADIGHTRTGFEQLFFLHAANFAVGIASQVYCAQKIEEAEAMIRMRNSTPEEKNAAQRQIEFYKDVQSIAGLATFLFSKVGIELISLSRSRSDEFEADKYGIHYMAKAGYNPRGALFLQKVFEEVSVKATGIDFLSTHPHPTKRYEANEQTIRELAAG